MLLAAVAKDWAALRYAPAELRGERAFMLAAVQLHGVALRYASAELKSDRALVQAAMAQSAEALRYAAPGGAEVLEARRISNTLKYSTTTACT